MRIHRLPLADIPAPVVAQDPNLRFSAKYRIESATWPYRFHVGDRIITINCGRPYTGWGSFKTKILDLVGILEASGLIPEPRRHSLRYIDLLNSDTMPGLASLQVGLNIGEHQIQSQPLQLRVELPDKDCAHVLQVAATAQVKLPDEEEQQGTLIDLDT